MAAQTSVTSFNVQIRQSSIDGDVVPSVSAKELHQRMGVGRDFTTWIRARINKFGFVEDVDYLLTQTGEQLPSGTKYSNDYLLTLDMAKQLAMVENNEQGRAARKYFIACEKAAKAKHEVLPNAPEVQALAVSAGPRH